MASFDDFGYLRCLNAFKDLFLAFNALQYRGFSEQASPLPHPICDENPLHEIRVLTDSLFEAAPSRSALTGIWFSRWRFKALYSTEYPYCDLPNLPCNGFYM